VRNNTYFITVDCSKQNVVQVAQEGYVHIFVYGYLDRHKRLILVDFIQCSNILVGKTSEFTLDITMNINREFSNRG
jgi:hypothetical protein